MAKKVTPRTQAIRVANAIARVLDAAEGELLSRSRLGIDADDKAWAANLSEEVKAQVLDDLARARGMTSHRENVSGLPQIPADWSSHQRLAAVLRALAPGAVVVGEEASPADWDAWAAARTNTRIFDLDPVDGSSLYDSLTFGYSGQVLAYVRTASGKDELLYSVTVNSTGWALIYLTNGEVYAGKVGRTLTRLVEPAYALDQVRHGFVAAVAAREEARMRAAELFDTKRRGWGLPGTRVNPDPALTVSTLGGAPAVAGLVVGRLAALVVTEPQTLHDAAPFLVAAVLGCYCIGEAGKLIKTSDLIDMFNILDRPTGMDYKPIPKMVIARDHRFGLLVAERVFSEGITDIVVERRPWIRIVRDGKRESNR